MVQREEWWVDWKASPRTWVSEGTYRAVEDHKAVVEVVVLHGGVAVELGQWVVAPGHTHTRSKKQCAPTHAYTIIHTVLWLMLSCCTSVCRSCWLLCGPGHGWELQSSEPRPPHRSGYSVRRRTSGWSKRKGRGVNKRNRQLVNRWQSVATINPNKSLIAVHTQFCCNSHTLLAVWALSMQPGGDSKADSAHDTTAFTPELKTGGPYWYFKTKAADSCQYFMQKCFVMETTTIQCCTNNFILGCVGDPLKYFNHPL